MTACRRGTSSVRGEVCVVRYQSAVGFVEFNTDAFISVVEVYVVRLDTGPELNPHFVNDSEVTLVPAEVCPNLFGVVR